MLVYEEGRSNRAPIEMFRSAKIDIGALFQGVKQAIVHLSRFILFYTPIGYIFCMDEAVILIDDADDPVVIVRIDIPEGTLRVMGASAYFSERPSPAWGRL